MSSIWSKLKAYLFPQEIGALTKRLENARQEQQRRIDALLDNEANLVWVQEALDRLVVAGMRIHPDADREDIVGRVIIALSRWCKSSDIAAFISTTSDPVAENSADLLVLMDACSMPGDSGGFANVVNFCIVNEDGAGEYLPNRIRELEFLACGDFEIEEVTETAEQDRLVGKVVLTNGHAETFEIEDCKRPDLTPLFRAINSLAGASGCGRYVAIITDDGDGYIVVYLRADEQAAFRNWAARQRYANGSTPGDWFE